MWRNAMQDSRGADSYAVRNIKGHDRGKNPGVHTFGVRISGSRNNESVLNRKVVHASFVAALSD
jgi:hypothetical protein